MKSMRAKMIASLLRQEIGFFDDPKNTSGGLTSGLSRSTGVVGMVCGIGLGTQVRAPRAPSSRADLARGIMVVLQLEECAYEVFRIETSI